MTRVLICGDRDWAARAPIRRIIQRMQPDDVLIEGEARGADSIARDCAIAARIEVDRYPALWAQYGRAAGPIRNQQMLKEGRPDIVVAFHAELDQSRGTKHMVSIAVKADIECWSWNGSDWTEHGKYRGYAHPLSSMKRRTER